MDVLAFLTLDIQRPNISAIVYGMQGDRQSRAIRAQLVDGSTQWTPPAGTFFVISYAKPDGTRGIYSQTETGNAAVTVSGSVATIALAEQVLTAAGDVPMTLTMFNTDGERLSAFTWLLIVKPAAYSDAAFRSTDYYNLLTEQITAILKAQESITGLTATATTIAPGSAATVTVTGGTGADDPFNFEIGIPRGDTGAQGATGAAAEITAQIVEYQAGTSGTTAPTGAWSTTVPEVPAGQYLWTRSTVTFNSGSPVVSYSVSRMGIDGTGSVKTVNNQSPDSSGDILLSSSNIPTPDYSSITAALAAKVDNADIIDVAHGGTGADNASDARQSLGVVGKADALTLEEIAASTDLSGKVASAQAAKDLVDYQSTTVQLEGNWSNYGSITLMRKGKVVVASLRAYKSNEGYLQQVSLGTVPEIYRPKTTVNSLNGYGEYGGSPSTTTRVELIGVMNIRSDGAIVHVVGSSRLYTAYASWVYFVD